MNNYQNINKLPPSIDEFLTPEYLGTDISSKLKESTVNVLRSYWNTKNTRSILQLPGGLNRCGTTLIEILSMIYLQQLLLFSDVYGISRVCTFMPFSTLFLTKDQHEADMYKFSFLETLKAMPFSNRLEITLSGDSIYLRARGKQVKVLFCGATKNASTRLLGTHLVGVVFTESCKKDFIGTLYKDIVVRARCRFYGSYYLRIIEYSSEEIFSISPSMFS